jgi:VCBS repeat-containing protein
MDGTNLEVYYYSLTGTFLGQFDVEGYGALDTESIEFNPINGTLFILSNLTYKVIIETDYTGAAVLNRINFAAATPNNPAGLAYAPASSGPPVMHFYITDRGEDNDTDPTENDGKMYEMTAPAPTVPDTKPPVIDAGVDQSIGLGATANLNGVVTDDGLPEPPADPVTTLWTMASGPGIVTFGDPNLLVTTATFSEIGNYALRLTGNNGVYSSYDELIVNVTNTTGSSILEVRLVGSSDDAEESSTTGSVDLTDPDLELVLDNDIQTVGMRFNGVNLPKNAIIDFAYVQFQAREINTHYVVLNIRGEKQDNPGTFVATSYDISSRIKTTASRNWTPEDWAIIDEAGVNQRTRDIKTVITELVSRPGWSDGNSMVIIITGSGRKRTAWSYDGLRSGAPKLHIEYTISPNEAPVAVDDTYSTPEDTQLTINQVQGVLHNDTDDSPTLTAIKYTDPTHGTVTLNSNGSFVYTPVANYYGPDSFTYYANDGQFNSNIATVNLTVTPVNDAPVANDQSVSTTQETAVDILLTATDLEANPLTWIIVSQPSHGILSGTAPAVKYTPNWNYIGEDSFTFKVNDGQVDSNIATVSITVNLFSFRYFLPFITR